jgi:hypothetical protein
LGASGVMLGDSAMTAEPIQSSELSSSLDQERYKEYSILGSCRDTTGALLRASPSKATYNQCATCPQHTCQLEGG